MKIDIRNINEEVIQIDFKDEPATHGFAFTLCKNKTYKGYVDLVTCSGNFVTVGGTDVENLIKALQKAVELGWTK